MLEDFRGKVAVITGGGSGIGAALARACAAEGMRVVVVDLNGELALVHPLQLRDYLVVERIERRSLGLRPGIERSDFPEARITLPVRDVGSGRKVYLECWGAIVDHVVARRAGSE